MQEAEIDPLWATFVDNGFILEEQDDNEERVTVSETDGPLTGVILNIQDDMGENDSRIYTVRMDGYERPVKFWGKTHIDRQVDSVGLELGREIGILKTGNGIDVGQPEPMKEFDVRYN